MPVIEWFFGYGASKAMDKVVDVFRRDPLAVDLDKTVNAWCSALPDDLALPESAALFPSHLLDMQLSEDSALLALRKCAQRNQMPATPLWEQALVEQWHLVHADNRQRYPLFDASEDVAVPHLKVLAKQLHQTAARHVKLFNPEVLRLLQALRTDVAALSGPSTIQEIFAQWANLVHQIAPAYQQAMTEGSAWPGAHWDAVQQENVLYLQLYGFIRAHARDPDASLETLTQFRDTPYPAKSQDLAHQIEQASAQT